LPTPPANLLVNGNFEGEYRDMPPSSRVAEGWSRWWLPGTEPGINHEPEFKEEYIWHNAIMVRHGDFAQKYFSIWATHTGGIYQRVPVPAGSAVRFSIWVRVWSSDCGDPCVTPLAPCHPEVNDNSNGEYRVAIGIDPTGGTDALADTVVWTPLVEHYDEWFEMEITATAEADAVTVFTQGTARWAVANNFSFWDDARLEVISPPAHAYSLSVGPPQMLGTAGSSHLPRLQWIRYSAEQIGRSDRCDARDIEWVFVENFGESTNVAGWTLEDADGHVFTFPDWPVPHGHGVRVWTTVGEPVWAEHRSDLYWGNPDEVLDDAGDRLILRDSDGQIVSEMCYSVSDQREPGACP
jgi:hypothetical protein